MLLQAIISFTYDLGPRPVSVGGAPGDGARHLLLLCRGLAAGAGARGAGGPFVPVLLAAPCWPQLPVAAQHRMLNRLTQTRESATTWRFFERLDEKRILIVTDRPNHFTIMDYGAMSFEAARTDAYLFTAFARHLFSRHLRDPADQAVHRPAVAWLRHLARPQARDGARVPERRRRAGPRLARSLRRRAAQNSYSLNGPSSKHRMVRDFGRPIDSVAALPARTSESRTRVPWRRPAWRDGCP